MTTPNPHVVEPLDEGRHASTPDELWSESYYADFVTLDGSLGGYIRLGTYPNMGVTWWTAMIVGVDRPLVGWTDYNLPALGAEDLRLAAEGSDILCDPVEPLGNFRVVARGTAEAHSAPEAIYRGNRGDPVDVDLDLTWQTDGLPYHYVLTTRYEIPCRVAGHLRVGDEDLAIVGQGQRDHSWGVRDWWSLSWCWAAARLDDWTRIHVTDVRFPNRPPFGYVQSGTICDTVTDLIVDEELGPYGFPQSAHIGLEPNGLSLTVTPQTFAPLQLVSADGRISRFPRAVARFESADGRSGAGWIEWNQPQALTD